MRFSKDYIAEINTLNLLPCKVSFIAQNYIIVDPVSQPNSGVDAIKLGLKMVVESDNWELSILSQAILFLIEEFEDLT